MKPLIAIVSLYDEKLESYWMLPGYAQGLEDAGASPVILPLTALSAGSYLFSGSVDFSEALPYLLGGLPGCWVGSRLLGKLSSTALSRIFGVLILFAAGRMWLS